MGARKAHSEKSVKGEYEGNYSHRPEKKRGQKTKESCGHIEKLREQWGGEESGANLVARRLTWT